MELRHLRYFVAVAREENITLAAARLHVSQPALSRQIRDLECELGVELFTHGAKAIRLTEAGRIFLNEANAVLQRAEDAIAVAKSVASGSKGVIQVGYAPSLMVEILPLTLRRFQQMSPGVRVQLHDLSTQEMLEGLKEGRLHAALMIRTEVKARRGIQFEELGRLAICVAAHPAHPLARRRRIGLAQVAQERLVAYTAADYPEYHAWLADLLAPLKRRPVISEEHDSSTSLIASVEAGHGVALVQQGFECLAGPRLKVRPISPAPAPFVIGVAYREEVAKGAVMKFVEVAREVGGESRIKKGE